jgi:hypothetical protein
MCAGLFLCPFETRYENRTNFAGRSDMCAATRGPIVTCDIDNPDIARSFRGFSQANLGDAFV